MTANPCIVELTLEQDSAVRMHTAAMMFACRLYGPHTTLEQDAAAGAVVDACNRLCVALGVPNFKVENWADDLDVLRDEALDEQADALARECSR